MASWIWQERYCIIAYEVLELTQYLPYNVYAFCNRYCTYNYIYLRYIYIIYYVNIYAVSWYAQTPPLQCSRCPSSHLMYWARWSQYPLSSYLVCMWFWWAESLGILRETNSLQHVYSRQRRASHRPIYSNMGRVPCHMRWERLWTLIPSLRLTYLFKRPNGK